MTVQYDAIALACNTGIRNGEWEKPFDPGDPPLFDAQLRASAKLALKHQAPLFLSGADTDPDHLETEARNHWVRLHKIGTDLPLASLKVVFEEDARSTTGNVLWTFAKFAASFGFYPTRIVFLGFPFKAPMFSSAAASLNLAGRFDYIGVADPAAGPRLDAARAGAAAKVTAMATGGWQAWRLDHQQRNPRNVPVSTFLDAELNRFAHYVFADGPEAPIPSWSWRVA